MNFLSKTICTAAIAFFGATANAAVIGFDDATGGGPNSSYIESGFRFAPAGSTGDTKCWGTKCLKEVNQTVGTTMTYDPDGDEIVDGTHSLDFFYFVAVGNTTTENNSFFVEGLNEFGNPIYKAEFIIGTTYEGTDFQTFGPGTTSVSFAKDIGSDPDDPSVINYNVGYWVDLTGWFGITSTNWFINSADGPTDGQWRLDCVGANEPNTSGANSGCSPAVIPIPAAGFLLIGALGSLVLLRGRRHA